MSDYASRYPLLVLLDTLRGWAEGVRHEDFWREGNSADYVNAIEDIRRKAKSLILWMELKGLENEATRLDETMEGFRRATWLFHRQSEGSCYPPVNSYCEQLRQVMAEQAETVGGCAEDLNDQIDPSIWKGFYDA